MAVVGMLNYATRSKSGNYSRALHLCACSLQSLFTNIFPTDQRFGGNAMSFAKNYVAKKRQRRRRKVAKARVKLYEEGKITHDKLPALSKKLLGRKMRVLKRSE